MSTGSWATWDDAIADIAAQLNRIFDEHDPNAVGAYRGNPVAHNPSNMMLWGGFMEAIGTRNRFQPTSVDTNRFGAQITSVLHESL